MGTCRRCEADGYSLACLGDDTTSDCRIYDEAISGADGCCVGRLRGCDVDGRLCWNSASVYLTVQSL